MKQTRKILALLVALTLVLGMAVTAFADPVPFPAGPFSLTIHKFEVPTMDDKEPGDGTSTTHPSDAVPLDGIEFTLYELDVDTTDPEAVYPVEPFAVSGTTLTDANSENFELTLISAKVTASGGVAAWTGLTQGLYLVVEEPNPAVTQPVEPFLVALPMTNPTGDGWLTDVHIYPKNQTNIIKKSVDKHSVVVGDLVTYTLGMTVPGNIGDLDTYIVTDTLDAALDYNSAAKPVTVYYTDNGGTLDTFIAAVKAGSVSDIIPANDGSNDLYVVSGDLVITFTAEGIAELANLGVTKLVIQFGCNVNSTILTYKDRVGPAPEEDPWPYTVPNSASLEFGVDSDNTTIDSNEVYIHTAAIDITKVDAADGATLLDGAVFAISRTEAEAKAGIYARLNTDGEIVWPCASHEDEDDCEWEELGSAADWTVTTADGLATFAGLADKGSGLEASDYRTYWLTELVAPEGGYHLLTGPVEVTFNDDLYWHDTDKGLDKGYTVEITVLNNNEFTLPATGGVGSVLFTVAGIGLLGLAIIMILTSRKKETQTA